VAQTWKASAFGRAAEARERAQRHVLLIRRPPRLPLELHPGQPDQPMKIPLPQRLDRMRIPALQKRNPVADSSEGLCSGAGSADMSWRTSHEQDGAAGTSRL